MLRIGSKFIFALLVPLVMALGATTEVSLTTHELRDGIDLGIHRVQEFELLANKAKELGVRLYLFGGTAASFAHYVRMDLLNKKGDQSFYQDRFDYDFTNIYRSTQDADLVVDGTEAQAQILENFIQQHLVHLLGTKAKWEVRLLKEARQDKGALLNDSQFLNQHTDSHSVGMIELTHPQKQMDRVKDLRDWNSTKPNFLEDVRRAHLKFYYSEKHRETKRYKEAKNPEILSVIRYMTNLVRFGLRPNPEDEKHLREIIQTFDPHARDRDSYVDEWFQKNGRKLLLHAQDIEGAWNLLERSGLRKKLLQLSNIEDQDSIAWWLNREPLRSMPIGQGNGKTAKELQIEVLAHDTRSMEAYEIITFSHRGVANVFISRETAVGESAALGNGFYTAVGHYGAHHNGLSIRFLLHPSAREGSDFIRHGNVIIVHNKNAIRIIPESIRLSSVEYIRLLKEQRFDKTDRGPIEKFKRRLQAHLKFSSDEEIAQLANEFRSLLPPQPDGEISSKSLPVFLEILKLMQGNRSFIENLNISPTDWLISARKAEPEVSTLILEFLQTNKAWFQENLNQSTLDWIENQELRAEHYWFWIHAAGFLNSLQFETPSRAHVIEGGIISKLETDYLKALTELESKFKKRIPSIEQEIKRGINSHLAESKTQEGLRRLVEREFAMSIELQTSSSIPALQFIGAVTNSPLHGIRSQLISLFSNPQLIDKMPRLRDKMIDVFKCGSGPLWRLSAEALAEFVPSKQADEFIDEIEDGIRKRYKVDVRENEILNKVLARTDWRAKSKVHLLALRKQPDRLKLAQNPRLYLTDIESLLAFLENIKPGEQADEAGLIVRALRTRPDLIRELKRLSPALARKIFWGSYLLKNLKHSYRSPVNPTLRRVLLEPLQSSMLLIFSPLEGLVESLIFGGEGNIRGRFKEHLRDLHEALLAVPQYIGIKVFQSCAREISKIRGNASYIHLPTNRH